MDFNRANSQSNKPREEQELFSPAVKLLLRPGAAPPPFFLPRQACVPCSFIGFIPSAPRGEVTSCILLMKPLVFSLLIACG